MPRILKYIAYLALFICSFVVFLYWMFPYDVLRERIAGAIEQQVGRQVNVSIGKLEPYWFTGVDIENLEIEGVGAGGARELISLKGARARAAIFSLLFGGPRVSFDLEVGKGEVSGDTAVDSDSIALDIDIDDLNFGDIGFIKSATGLNLSSRIGGYVKLDIDRARPVRSKGKVSLDLRDIKIRASSLSLGEMELPLPELTVTKGRGSSMEVEIGKGVVEIKALKLVGGDLEIDLTGKIFLSTKVDNYRLNLKGSFKPSAKLGEVLPFLFIIEKQKGPDGSYPLTITGRMSRPSIKIGTFKLPI
jgi:type II secretion system protein N